MNNTEQRLDELETKFSYQDHLISQLNEVIIAHQQQLDQQAEELTRLRLLLADAQNIATGHDAVESPPPHY